MGGRRPPTAPPPVCDYIGGFVYVCCGLTALPPRMRPAVSERCGGMVSVPRSL